jgi:hypothetical protein
MMESKDMTTGRGGILDGRRDKKLARKDNKCVGYR